jgi:hypothetical protein
MPLIECIKEMCIVCSVDFSIHHYAAARPSASKVRSILAALFSSRTVSSLRSRKRNKRIPLLTGRI